MKTDDTTCTVTGCARPADDAFVCRPCTSDLERWLAEVPWLLDELNLVVSRQTQYANPYQPPAASAEHPLPLNLKASDVTADLVCTLESWVRMLLEENPHWTAPGQHRVYGTETSPGATNGIGAGVSSNDVFLDAHSGAQRGVKAYARWLQSRVNDVRHHAAGGDLVEEIAAAVAACTYVIDRPAERVYSGPCECGSDLYAKPGQADAECRDCGATYPVEAMQEWMWDQVADQLVTAREGARLLTWFGHETQQKTIDTWTQRGKVAYRGHNKHGARLFRFGELMSLAAKAEAATRRRQRVAG